MHVEGLVEVNLSDDSKHPKVIYLGDILTKFECILAMSLLIKYQKIFAFYYEDMSGLDPNLVMHNIMMYPNAKLIK